MDEPFPVALFDAVMILARQLWTHRHGYLCEPKNGVARSDAIEFIRLLARAANRVQRCVPPISSH